MGMPRLYVAALAASALAILSSSIQEKFERPFLELSEFVSGPLLGTARPPERDPLERDAEALPTMYPLEPGFTGTLPPKATRMMFVGPRGNACDCPLGKPEDSVCLYSNGQGFTNECVAQCYGHKPRHYYRCKVKMPLYRKLN